jgi:hypothetical protein
VRESNGSDRFTQLDSGRAANPEARIVCFCPQSETRDKSLIRLFLLGSAESVVGKITE